MQRALAPALFIIAALSAFAGCMTDEVTGPEVRSRVVLPPSKVWFYSPVASYVAPDKGDLVIRWSRSAADTQLNFKGYYVELFRSVQPTSVDDTESLIQPAVGSIHVRKLPGELDTSATFSGMTTGRYTARVWGEKATDTLGYSQDFGHFTFEFDPKPLANPSVIQATSNGPNSVRLNWDLPASASNPGSWGFVVFYRNPNDPHDSAHHTPIITKDTFGGPGSHQIVIGIPGLKDPLRASNEQAYQFWVKAIRNDSAFFYGSDTNSVVWSGAILKSFPPQLVDSAHQADPNQHGFRHAIFMGQVGANYDVSDDSIDANAQIKISINNGQVTLDGMNGAKFLDGHVDPASALDSIFYTTPYSDPAQFNTPSVTLPAMSDTNLVMYVMFPDRSWQNNTPNEWARILVYRQSDGSFVNASGGINIAVSFQPGVAFGGNSHLSYY